MSDSLSFSLGGRRAAVPLIGFALIAYLGYHAFIGERGLITQWRLAGEAREMTERLAALRAERAVLEHKITLLGGERIDPDMLDERVRAVLNFAHPDEIVILHPKD